MVKLFTTGKINQFNMIITSDDIFKNCSIKLKGFEKHYSIHNAPAEKVEGIVVRLGTNLDKRTLSGFKKLKFVATVTTGLDHIDLDYCAEKKIAVLSLKGETDFLNSITATPEHTWGLLLSLMRKIPSANESVKTGHWNRDLFFGNELSGKTIGIVGLGRVGRIIADYAAAFRMTILYCDPSVTNAQYKKVDMDTLLAESDVVTIHTPLDDSTEHLINKSHFEKMVKAPFFLNTARGKIVNEDDLLWALKEKKIKGAAIDVLEHEVRFQSKKVESLLLNYLNTHDNLIITPHIAGSTYESMIKTALFIETKVLIFFPEYK
jgi:D-3-phosphoglycerate dehydrogenase